MKINLRQSFQTGIASSVVHTFFVLIGFNAMLAGIISKLFVKKPSGPMPEAAYFIIYCLLLAILTGYIAARKNKGGKIGSKLLSGSLGGSALALGSLPILLILAALVTREVDPRLYLPQLSQDFMKATLLQLQPVTGIIANIGLFIIGGCAGALLDQLGRFRSLSGITGRMRAVWNKVLFFFGSQSRGKYGWLWKALPLALAAVAIIILPLKWGSYWNYVIGSVGLYVILGLGLNIIVGLSGQLVLGYIAFFAIGAYSVGLLNSVKPHNLMWGFWPGLAVGIVLAALAGILLGLPLMRLRGDYLAIVTLGFGEIIRILLKSDLLTNFTGGPRGIQSIQVPKWFGKDFNHIEFTYLIILAVLVSIFIYNRLARSRTGRAWLSIREDETVAKATGVNTVRYKLLALALGAALAGLAGGIYASRNQFTGPNEHGLMASINVLSLIIVGGMGNVPGTILGAFALKGLPEILREFENYRLLAFGALLVIMMLSRPEGLIPTRHSTIEVPEDKLTKKKDKEEEHAGS